MLYCRHNVLQITYTTRYRYLFNLKENRVRYNQCNYRRVFEEKAEEHKVLKASESEPSLSECVQRWLERTPGLEEHGFNFPAKFKSAVDSIFDMEIENIEVSLVQIKYIRKLALGDFKILLFFVLGRNQ